MKTYNLDFLIAGLTLLLLVLYHFEKQKKPDNTNNRIFQAFITTALADVSFDILSTLLIMSENAALASITKGTLTVFISCSSFFRLPLYTMPRHCGKPQFKKSKKL